MIARVLGLAFLLAAGTSAQAQIYLTGNDIGGMISWSPEAERVAFAASDAHCAAYGKLARVTSVYRQYGHYIGFECVFPRGYVIRERQFAIRTKG
jgi:hypothetical protein